VSRATKTVKAVFIAHKVHSYIGTISYLTSVLLALDKAVARVLLSFIVIITKLLFFFICTRSFVLCMLPKLKSLDTLLLAEETKMLAEATFLKKQMYYNMRIKTMRRNARNLIKMASEGKKVRRTHGRTTHKRLKHSRTKAGKRV
jgi:hypothetical protein